MRALVGVVAFSLLAALACAQPYVAEVPYYDGCSLGPARLTRVYKVDVCYESRFALSCNATAVTSYTCTVSDGPCNCTVEATGPLGSCVELGSRTAAVYSCVDVSIQELEQTFRRPNNQTFFSVETRTEGPDCSPAPTVSYEFYPSTCRPRVKRSALDLSYGYSICNATSTINYACNDSVCADCVLSDVLPLLSCQPGENAFVNYTCLILPALPAPVAPPVAPPVAAPAAPTPIAAPVAAGSPTSSNSTAPTGTSSPTTSAAPTAGNAPTSVSAPSGGNSTAPTVRAPSSASTALPAFSLLAASALASLLL